VNRYHVSRKSVRKNGSGASASAQLISAFDISHPTKVLRVQFDVSAAAATLILYRHDSGDASDREIGRWTADPGHGIDRDNLVGVDNRPNATDNAGTFGSDIYYEVTGAGSTWTLNAEYVDPR